MFQKGHSVLQGCLLAQALNWERMSLTAELKLSPCFVYVNIFPGLCLLLGWKCPAKNSSSPCWLCGQRTSCLFDDSSALEREQCLVTGWRHYRGFPGRMNDGLGNTVLSFGAALQVFQARFCKSFHLVQILGCEHRWSQR